MADYTHVNFKEIDDMAPKYGMAPDLEFRMGRTALELEKLGVSYERMAPGFRLPFGHKHGAQEEVYVLLSGSAQAKVGDDVVELKPWDALRVGNDTMRSFEAGPDGAEFLVAGAPIAKETDAEMEQGWW